MRREHDWFREHEKAMADLDKAIADALTREIPPEMLALAEEVLASLEAERRHDAQQADALLQPLFEEQYRLRGAGESL